MIKKNYNELNLDNLEDVKSYFAKRKYNSDHYIFRGHENKNYLLLPSAGRPISEKDIYKNLPLYFDYLSYERDLIQKLQFFLKKHDSPTSTHFSGNTENLIEVLAYAQHYKFKTRLLDWTNNNKIAIGFACGFGEINSDIDGAIWILKTNNNPRYTSRIIRKNIILEQESPSNNNQTNQKGLFVRHVIKKMDEKFLRYETLKRQKKYLVKVTFNGSIKKELRNWVHKEIPSILIPLSKNIDDELEELKKDLYETYGIPFPQKSNF